MEKEFSRASFRSGFTAAFPVANSSRTAHCPVPMKSPPASLLEERSTLPTNEPQQSARTVSPLQAFTGDISPTRVSPLYNAGLAVVAFAMVLLPAIYIALIAMTAWGVFYHVVHNTWILGGDGRGIGKLILYFGPAAVGGILIFFMVKPFFARQPKPPQLISLDPKNEPLLFAFI